MADEVASEQGAEGTETPEEAPATEALGDAGKQALDRMKAERNEAKKEAQALRKEVDEIRKSSMSEAEKAVAEAEARGRASATTEFGTRLAKADFVAAAARRNPGFDAKAVLEDLNLARFVGDDGEPDAKAIEAAVQRLVPEVNGVPSFDGGTRTTPPAATGMTSLIRKAAGRA